MSQSFDHRQHSSGTLLACLGLGIVMSFCVFSKREEARHHRPNSVLLEGGGMTSAPQPDTATPEEEHEELDQIIKTHPERPLVIEIDDHGHLHARSPNRSSSRMAHAQHH